jgi:hypothetical protein
METRHAEENSTEGTGKITKFGDKKKRMRRVVEGAKEIELSVGSAADDSRIDKSPLETTRSTLSTCTELAYLV